MLVKGPLWSVRSHEEWQRMKIHFCVAWRKFSTTRVDLAETHFAEYEYITKPEICCSKYKSYMLVLHINVFYRRRGAWWIYKLLYPIVSRRMRLLTHASVVQLTVIDVGAWLSNYIILIQINVIAHPLRWRHNGRDRVSNHQPHDCLLNRLFRCRSKKTPKLRVTGLCAGNSPGTGEFPAQMASNAENVPISWRHHPMSEIQCRFSQTI